jgi:hypothetical protein
MSIVLLGYGQRNPLVFSFRPYRKMPGVFDGENFLPSLVWITTVQLVLEVFADTACMLYEKRKGLDVPEALRRYRKKIRGVAIISCAAVVWGTLGGIARGMYGDSFEACAFSEGRVTNISLFSVTYKVDPSIHNWGGCLGSNICHCTHGVGLVHEGLREKYCELLYPPDGRPKLLYSADGKPRPC